MSIRPTNAFTFQAVPRLADRPETGRLLQGAREVATLEGGHLHHQFDAGDGRTLLLLTNDSPFEEVVHIYLLNDRFEILDHVRIAYPTDYDLLEDVQVRDGDRVEFSYMLPGRWSLRVLAEPQRPRRLMPILGVSPANPFRKHYLHLELLPQPHAGGD